MATPMLVLAAIMGKCRFRTHESAASLCSHLDALHAKGQLNNETLFVDVGAARAYQTLVARVSPPRTGEFSTALPLIDNATFRVALATVIRHARPCLRVPLRRGRAPARDVQGRPSRHAGAHVRGRRAGPRHAQPRGSIHPRRGSSAGLATRALLAACPLLRLARRSTLGVRRTRRACTRSSSRTASRRGRRGARPCAARASISRHSTGS